MNSSFILTKSNPSRLVESQNGFSNLCLPLSAESSTLMSKPSDLSLHFHAAPIYISRLKLLYKSKRSGGPNICKNGILGDARAAAKFATEFSLLCSIGIVSNSTVSLTSSCSISSASNNRPSIVALVLHLRSSRSGLAS